MEVKQIGNLWGENTEFDNRTSGRVYDKDGISPTLNTMQGGGKQPMIIANINPSGNGMNGAIFSIDGEAPTLTTNKGEGNKIIVAMRGRNPDNPSDRTVGAPTEQRLEPNSQGLCNTLTSVQKDNLVMEVKQLGFMDNGTGKHQSNTVYDENSLCPNITTIEGGGTQQIKVMTENVYDFYNNNLKSDGVCGTLTSACSHNGSGTFGVIEPQYRIRKLTPLECWRLMDFADEDFLSAKLGSREVAKEILKTYPHLGKRAFTEVQRIEKMSNTQLYKQAGNSIVKNVLVAIIGQMIPGKEDVYKNQPE